MVFVQANAGVIQQLAVDAVNVSIGMVSSSHRDDDLSVLMTKADDLESKEDTAPVGFTNDTIRRLAQEYDIPLLDLRHAVEARDAAGAVLSLKELIPEYSPSAFVLERALGEPAQRTLARAV